MEALQGKTPISYLQEMCTKRGITPQYDLVANEGAVHEPTFIFRATAGTELIGTGKGPSKKKAKHNAALAVLGKMLGINNGQAVVEDYSGTVTSGDANNPVGELQEMTQKKLWPPPIYDYSTDSGSTHTKDFVCNIRLWKLTEKGTGKSKKSAKRNAATAMINLIKQGGMPPVDYEATDDYGDDNVPLEHPASTYSSTKDGRVSSTTTNDNAKITEYYSKLTKRGGQYLKLLQETTIDTSGNLPEMLHKLAMEQKFIDKYILIEQKSMKGQFQCLASLSTTPSTVCFGIGNSLDEAKAQAAFSALQYLKVMTQPRS